MEVKKEDKHQQAVLDIKDDNHIFTSSSPTSTPKPKTIQKDLKCTSWWRRNFQFFVDLVRDFKKYIYLQPGYFVKAVAVYETLKAMKEGDHLLTTDPTKHLPNAQMEELGVPFFCDSRKDETTKIKPHGVGEEDGGEVVENVVDSTTITSSEEDKNPIHPNAPHADEFSTTARKVLDWRIQTSTKTSAKQQNSMKPSFFRDFNKSDIEALELLAGKRGLIPGVRLPPSIRWEYSSESFSTACKHWLAVRPGFRADFRRFLHTLLFKSGVGSGAITSRPSSTLSLSTTTSSATSTFFTEILKQRKIVMGEDDKVIDAADTNSTSKSKEPKKEDQQGHVDDDAYKVRDFAQSATETPLEDATASSRRRNGGFESFTQMWSNRTSSTGTGARGTAATESEPLLPGDKQCFAYTRLIVVHKAWRLFLETLERRRNRKSSSITTSASVSKKAQNQKQKEDSLMKSKLQAEFEAPLDEVLLAAQEAGLEGVAVVTPKPSKESKRKSSGTSGGGSTMTPGSILGPGEDFLQLYSSLRPSGAGADRLRPLEVDPIVSPFDAFYTGCIEVELLVEKTVGERGIRQMKIEADRGKVPIDENVQLVNEDEGDPFTLLSSWIQAARRCSAYWSSYLPMHQNTWLLFRKNAENMEFLQLWLRLLHDKRLLFGFPFVDQSPLGHLLRAFKYQTLAFPGLYYPRLGTCPVYDITADEAEAMRKHGFLEEGGEKEDEHGHGREVDEGEQGEGEEGGGTTTSTNIHKPVSSTDESSTSSAASASSSPLSSPGETTSGWKQKILDQLLPESPFGRPDSFPINKRYLTPFCSPNANRIVQNMHAQGNLVKNLGTLTPQLREARQRLLNLNLMENEQGDRGANGDRAIREEEDANPSFTSTVEIKTDGTRTSNVVGDLMDRSKVGVDRPFGEAERERAKGAWMLTPSESSLQDFNPLTIGPYLHNLFLETGM
ncbi:unnamed protein product [Amoebophrya sp. A25]|nr:unnamed protein product [Amoebophrya sp. A25]|eukprot:GSA25T00012661001.1